MNELYSKLLEVSLEYGEGYNQMVGAVQEDITKNYDFSFSLKEKVLDYHINKIIYSLNSNQGIQSLKMIYKNRNDGHLETLLDTVISHVKDEKENQIIFEDFEEIIQVRFWVRKDKLIGFSIKTNRDKIKIIGYGNNEELIKDGNIETGKKIIFGFGVQAGLKHGVSSMYCYYMDKNQFGIIEYSGLLQLRAKLKVNPKYKAEMKEKKKHLNEKQKLVLETCELPDTAFFPIASYIMSH